MPGLLLEAAAKSGLSEIEWRKRAAGDELPGAVKRGKQWLIPAKLVPEGVKKVDLAKGIN